MNECKRNAFSLVEILVCIAVLGTGGITLYSAAGGASHEAAWGAERVFAEGLARDLVETYRQLDYCALKSRPEVKPSEAAVTAADLATIEQMEVLSATSLRQADAGDPAAAAPDAVSDEYTRMLGSLKVERMVLFEEVDAESAVATCIVKWKSRSGRPQRIERRFGVVRRAGCAGGAS
jgi:hypothetical protein